MSSVEPLLGLKVITRPEPIMLIKLPIMLLSNAMLQNFPYYAPIMLHCTQLCSNSCSTVTVQGFSLIIHSLEDIHVHRISHLAQS